ncbi:hypothetical protein HZA99_04460, partial [Candidatus Woesearchaeota archaeon]|nr:hypothetical protein [Candidatus Woesearchaeota archaeon]
DAPITSTYACPKCGYFSIKFKTIPEVKLLKETKEVKPEAEKAAEKKRPSKKFKNLFKKKIEKPVETKTIEEFPSEFFEEKPLKPVSKFPKSKLKDERTLQIESVELPESVEPVGEKEIIPEEIELPKVGKTVEIKPKKIKEVAKTYRIPESSLKKAFTRIVEIEKRIPERVSDVTQVDELKQMIGRIERNVRHEKINVVPEVIEKLLETKEKIERLKLPEKLDPVTEVKNKIRELEMKKDQMNEAKEVVKARYYKGELDENALKNIMENYEQELIRTEVEIKQYKKLLKDLGKKKPPTEVSIPPATEIPKTFIPPETIQQPVQQPQAVIPTIREAPIEITPPIVRSPGTMIVRPIRLPYLGEDNRPPRKRTSLIPRLPEIELRKTEGKKVETSLDKMLRMVEERGSIDIGEIAKALSVKEDHVEEWGKILEEHNLVRLSYPPFGKPVLRKIK